MGGAGLAAAPAAASKTGASDKGKDALGEFDARKSGGDDTAEGGAGFLG